MRAEHLFEAIGLVDDRLIEEAADARGSGGHWKSWVALAACLAIVVGIGSVSMSVLFRGCGAKSAAPETSDMTDSAGVEENAAPAEVPDVDMPADAPAEPAEPPQSGEGAPEGDQPLPTYSAALPLTADRSGLSFRREVRTEPVDGETQRVLDTYWVTNTTGETMEAGLRYTVAVAQQSGGAPEIQVEGQPAQVMTMETLDQGDLIETFPVTIEAGQSVEITAAYLLPVDQDVDG